MQRYFAVTTSYHGRNFFVRPEGKLMVTPLSPAFGKPAKKWEKHGPETLLRKVHYQYDERGYPIREDHYDAEETYRYSIERTYDAAGRILEEIDPEGHKTSHSYDANGNKILTTREDISIEYLYDYCNRLVKEIEHHPHARHQTNHARWHHHSADI